MTIARVGGAGTHGILRRLRGRAREDEGSTMLLTIGYGILALALVIVVIAATSLLIERRRLFTLADGAALAGAEAFAVEQLVGEEEASPQLADAAVEEAAADWLEAAPTTLDDVVLVEASSLDGQTAQVTVAAAWRPPVVAWLLPEGIPMDVTVTARAVLW